MMGRRRAHSFALSSLVTILSPQLFPAQSALLSSFGSVAFSFPRNQRQFLPFNGQCSYPRTLWTRHDDWNKHAYPSRLRNQAQAHDLPIDPRSLAQETFSVLAKSSRTWRRLGHLVDLACSDRDGMQTRSVADIGCDHGLLAMGLAVSGRFDKVLGVDASERALQDGALAFHKELLRILHRGNRSNESSLAKVLPVEFRVGNGLHEIQPGEADLLCMAGIGIHSMLKILLLSTSCGEDFQIDNVRCRKIVLQPTNSRPRYMIILYDGLQENGWRLASERIEYVSSRWYMSVSFVRDHDSHPVGNDKVLPGVLLAQLKDDDPMRVTYNEYVHHHQKWCEDDSQKNGAIGKNDQRWLEFSRLTGNDKN